MFDYFKKRKEEKERLAREASEQAVRVAEALKFKEEFDKAAEEEKISKAIIMESDVPYYKLIGAEYTLVDPPTDPIDERYEYNKAFIKMLRKQGYTGESDSGLISAWEKAEAETRFAAESKKNREAKMTSHEPWVEIVSETYDEALGQVSMKLDWNPAFIRMLRQNGFSGKDDQELVDRWFKGVSESIAMDLHNEKFDG